jgi:tRNA (guanine-N7-)-methyltransferase
MAAPSAVKTAMSPALHNARAFFGRRKGHKLRPRQAGLFTTLLPRLAIDVARPAPAELSSLFAEPVAALALEIGFGGGEAMIAQAKAHPQIGFLGVEPFVNGMAKALAAIEAEGLRNIRLHFGDAVGLIEWLPASSLVLIDLIHPDPWPKRRHWKRRFVQDEMIEQLGRILQHAAWTLQRLMRSSRFEWTANCADDWRNPWPGFIATRYHAKAAREQRTSCFLVFRKI